MQTELHRHLDVSLRLATLLELAQARGLEPKSTSLESFQEKIILKRPLSNLEEVLATFTLFQEVLDRPEVLERVGFEVVEDCLNEGTQAVELRFSPNFVTEKSGLSWEDVLSGFEQGLARAREAYPAIRAGLICIASRNFGPEAVDRTVEFFLKHQARFIGLDLAGDEKGYPCRLFEKSFQKAARAGAKITIHAGEGAGPENVWEAIELLGARRIGHGIASAQDPELLKVLAARGICLEICPTSNLLTKTVNSLQTHPLPKILRSGVRVCINTDDPGVFGVTLPHEIRVCRDEMGMSREEIDQCMEFASQSSFLS